ncbi:MAG: response regulator [bacterium]|nr:response regulator [bacterium]
MEQFILIADDDPAMAKLIQTVVEGEGYVAATAKDGKEAYNALKSGAEFVGAIIDINMPYIDGNDLLNFMRKDDRFAKVPVLIMTGDRDPRASARAISSGAIGFLPKPFTNSQLRTAIQTLVASRGSQ